MNSRLKLWVKKRKVKSDKVVSGGGEDVGKKLENSTPLGLSAR